MLSRIAVGALFLVSTLAQADATRFSVIPTSVQAGEEVTLDWQATGAASVFISQVGVVRAEGKTTLRLIEPAVLGLIVDQGDRLEVKTVKVDVRGARGESHVDPASFKNPMTHKIKGVDAARLLESLYKILQDDMKYSIEMLQAPEGRVVLITNSKNQPSLIKPEERKIRYRRVAYMVDIEKSSDNSTTYTIRALVEYQRMIEKTWRRQDPDGSDMYRQVIESVGNRIKAIRGE